MFGPLQMGQAVEMVDIASKDVYDKIRDKFRVNHFSYTPAVHGSGKPSTLFYITQTQYVVNICLFTYLFFYISK